MAAIWRIEELTRRISIATTLHLNTDKSVRFAAAAAVRRGIGDRSGFPVVSSFRDLGVDQRLGLVCRSGGLERRLRAAKLRFVR